MIFSSWHIFQKTNEWIQLYYDATCFPSFFEKNWRFQNDISKLTDLEIRSCIHTLTFVQMKVKCTLDLLTLNLVTTCDLEVTIFHRPFFNLLPKIIRLSDICNLVTIFEDTKSVTKSKLLCIINNLGTWKSNLKRTEI